MSGVTGDLMSMQTYRKHTWTTLKERGMVCDENDPVMHAVTDDPYGLRLRVMQLASNKINELVDGHPDMVEALKRPDDPRLTPEKQKEMRDRRLRRMRVRLYTEMDLPDELDGFRDVAHITPGRASKLTYHNKKRDKAENEANRKSKRKGVMSADSASQFKDPKRMNSAAMPGKRRVTVHARGLEDSRMRL